MRTFQNLCLHDFGEDLLVNALVGGHWGEDIVEGECPALVALCTYVVVCMYPCVCSRAREDDI